MLRSLVPRRKLSASATKLKAVPVITLTIQAKAVGTKLKGRKGS